MVLEGNISQNNFVTFILSIVYRRGKIVNWSLKRTYTPSLRKSDQYSRSNAMSVFAATDCKWLGLQARFILACACLLAGNSLSGLPYRVAVFFICGHNCSKQQQQAWWTWLGSCSIVRNALGMRKSTSCSLCHML